MINIDESECLSSVDQSPIKEIGDVSVSPAKHIANNMKSQIDMTKFQTTAEKRAKVIKQYGEQPVTSVSGISPGDTPIKTIPFPMVNKSPESVAQTSKRKRSKHTKS